ncbi:hypothetical protein RRG08_061368 [Elysia crispata]|uniref:Uncharacterized protein n=1 Tax=Elysia crispata TaxID=231223 RepID=A0AAE1AFT2_9GAST|nr:hypothetical protein RRG08_061368 [Elysia crispata]
MCELEKNGEGEQNGRKRAGYKSPLSHHLARVINAVFAEGRDFASRWLSAQALFTMISTDTGGEIHRLETSPPEPDQTGRAGLYVLYKAISLRSVTLILKQPQLTFHWEESRQAKAPARNSRRRLVLISVRKLFCATVLNRQKTALCYSATSGSIILTTFLLENFCMLQCYIWLHCFSQHFGQKTVLCYSATSGCAAFHHILVRKLLRYSATFGCIAFHNILVGKLFQAIVLHLVALPLPHFGRKTVLRYSATSSCVAFHHILVGKLFYAIVLHLVALPLPHFGRKTVLRYSATSGCVAFTTFRSENCSPL